MHPHYCQYFRQNSPRVANPVTIAPGINLVASESAITIELPFPSITSVFYRAVQDGILLSTDLRKLHVKGDALDPAAMASLLLLGFTVPPLTPFREVHALAPGFKHVIDLETREPRSELSVNWSSPVPGDGGCTVEMQGTTIAQALDATLGDLCPKQDPIVLLSGGVDSSLLASRISSMGWKRTSYIHCSFGEQDAETIAAKGIAAELGIAMDVAVWDAAEGHEALSRAAELFPVLFCDSSCVPTHSLSKALISRYEGNRVVLDGSGADSCFGLFGKEHKSRLLYSIPGQIRRLLSALYGPLSLWERTSALEYYGRLIRRSALLPEPMGSIAQNPLLGIGFRSEAKDVRTVASCLHDWLCQLSGALGNAESLPLIGIGLSVPGRTAQKNLDPLLDSKFRPEYPYLDHRIVDLALTRARCWPGSTESKLAMKHLLSRSISEKYVYRKKAGFSAPPVEQFSDPMFIQHLEAACEPASALYGMIETKLVRRLLKAIRSRRMLASQTYNFIWAIAFCNAWLSQLDRTVIASAQDCADSPV